MAVLSFLLLPPLCMYEIKTHIHKQMRPSYILERESECVCEREREGEDTHLYLPHCFFAYLLRSNLLIVEVTTSGM